MPKRGRKSCKHVLYREFNKSIALSPESESISQSLGLTSSVRSHKRFSAIQAKRDYLSRLFQKKKLKEKSLSKKLHTPFDRKLYRTCWPIEMSKISKIKKKPKEKKKGKPHYKSLRKKKFSKSMLVTHLQRNDTRISPSCCSSETDDAFEEAMRNFNPIHFLYEPVTPQMLMEVLQDPELLKSGATLDMIIAKLKNQQSNSNRFKKSTS